MTLKNHFQKFTSSPYFSPLFTIAKPLEIVYLNAKTQNFNIVQT